MTYTIEGLEGIELDPYDPEDALENGYSLNASKEVGQVDNLEDYGLTDPQAEVEVEFQDGSTYHYLVGSASAGDGSSYYLCAADSNLVYVASISEELFYSPLDFVETTLVSITNPDDTTGQSGITMESIELSGTQFPSPISIVQDDNGVFRLIYNGKELDVDTQRATTLMTSFSTLEADKTFAAHPDEDVLADCGFTEPTAVADFSAYGEDYKITVGKQEGTQWYVMRDGVDVIYLIEDSKLNTWMETNAFLLRDKFVLLTNIVDVDQMEVTLDGDSYVFDLSRTKDEEQSTEDNPVYDYTLTGNGKELTYENFQKYYQSIIAIQLLEPTDEQPVGEPEITVTYEYYPDTGEESNTVEFYPSSDRRYIATVNGDVAGIVKEENLQRVRDNTPKIMNDEEVNPGI